MELTSRHDPILIAILLILIISCPLYASANDSSFGGIGADLSPQKRSDVVMLSEDIKAIETQYKGGMVWAIEAKYVFKNPSAKRVHFTMGFPERLCHPDSDCASPSDDHTTFRDIVTTVDGVRTNTVIKAIGNKNKQWSELGRVHLFEIDFDPKQIKEIRHTYYMGISTSVEGELSFQYITKTGAMWGAPIGKARFTIGVQHRPIGFHFPNEYTLKSYETTAGKNGLNTVTFEQNSWTPKRDLELTFTYEMTQVFNCPLLRHYFIETKDLLSRVKRLLSSSQFMMKPTPDDESVASFINATSKLSKKDLKLCRNLPFARYGYQFKNKELSTRLYQYAQPSPLSKMRTDYKSYTYSQEEAELKSMSAVLFRPSKHYSQTQLSEDDWLYIKVLKLIEQSRK